jgi:ADP-ribose pyrophosphatase YjhB (NUDIX family)
MKNKTLVREIFDTDFDPKYEMGDLWKYGIRRASRGILIKNDKIALLNVTKSNYHKLPGGGVEINESIEEAFKRESIEETGCNCEILDQGGIVIEWREQFKLLQISYVFLARVLGKPGQWKLEQGEIDEGFELEWVSTEEIDEVLANDKPTNYEGKFIKLRDKSIVEFYKNKLSVL